MLQVISPDASQSVSQKPFLVELQRLDEKPNGSFRPHARLILTPGLRLSGLWHYLPPEEFKTLFLLLTFLTPNGWCQPTLLQLTAAMQTSESKARARLMRLAQFQWQDTPLVTELKRENGLDAWVPAATLLETQEVPIDRLTISPVAPIKSAGRDAVIALSRARYASPREQVERDIGTRMGWEPPEERELRLQQDAQQKQIEEDRLTTVQKELLDRLLQYSVARDQALALLREHTAGSIQQQIDWLPYRHAKNPARFLIAAIAGNYQPPMAIRTQHLASTTASPVEATSADADPTAPAQSLGTEEPKLQTSSENTR